MDATCCAFRRFALVLPQSGKAKLSLEQEGLDLLSSINEVSVLCSHAANSIRYIGTCSARTRMRDAAAALTAAGMNGIACITISMHLLPACSHEGPNITGQPIHSIIMAGSFHFIFGCVWVAFWYMQPVAPIVVIGPYRSGKSFLLNQLLGVPCGK